MTSQGPVRVTVIPAEVVRLGAMASTLLEEAQQVPIDEAARRRLEEATSARCRSWPLPAHCPRRRAEPLRASLQRELPTQAELRVAQAQLVGWLEGLFHGIQFALFTPQMAARSQLEDLHRPAGQAAGREPVPSSGAYL